MQLPELKQEGNELIDGREAFITWVSGELVHCLKLSAWHTRYTSAFREIFSLAYATS